MEQQVTLKWRNQKMKRGKRRVISFILAVACVVSLGVGIPSPKKASASNFYGDVTYLEVDGSPKVKQKSEINALPYNGTIPGGWYYVQGSYSTYGNPKATGDIHIVLLDGCSLSPAYYYRSGFFEGADSVHIYAQSTDPSKMGRCDIYLPEAKTVINGGNVTLLEYSEYHNASSERLEDTCVNELEINGGNVVGIRQHSVLRVVVLRQRRRAFLYHLLKSRVALFQQTVFTSRKIS